MKPTVICRANSLLLLLLAVTAASVEVARADYAPLGCVTTEEAELAQLINDYRGENGLAPVPLSQTLIEVAQWHVQDALYAIHETGQFGSDPSCNLHSWYGVPSAPYSTCCYTPDHAQASCMWDKPSEIEGSFTGLGYEIAGWGFETVESALAGWQGSPAHDDLLLDQGVWAGRTWTGMGVGVDLEQKLYFVWFTEGSDPAGTAEECAVTSLPPPRPGALESVRLFPNPANPRASVEFELGADTEVSIEIFDAGGRRVRVWPTHARTAGAQRVTWSGRDDAGDFVSSGIYFVRVRAGDEAWNGKLALVR